MASIQRALVVLISDNASFAACPLIMIDWNRKIIGMQVDAEAEADEEEDDDSNRSLALLLLVGRKKQFLYRQREEIDSGPTSRILVKRVKYELSELASPRT
jgi:hypothetical protein